MNPSDSGRQVLRRSPFAYGLGIEVLEAGDGRCRARLKHDPALTDHHGAVHRGALATLADLSIGLAIRSLTPPGYSTPTIDLKLSSLRPIQGTVIAEAVVLRLGQTTAVGHCEIRDEAGELGCKAMATFAVRSQGPPAVRSEAPPQEAEMRREEVQTDDKA